MNKKGSGFTIVELLVVIVVIAILAAITIVSYNGITQQAQNAQLLGKVDAYTKALQIYKIQNGGYPSVDVNESGYANFACLGSTASFPADSTYEDTSCYKATITVNASTTLANQLRTISSNLPDAALPSVTSSDGTMSIRGLLYFTASPFTTANLQYVIKGDQSCARGTKNYNLANWPGTTFCTVTLS